MFGFNPIGSIKGEPKLCQTKHGLKVWRDSDSCIIGGVSSEKVGEFLTLINGLFSQNKTSKCTSFLTGGTLRGLIVSYLNYYQ